MFLASCNGETNEPTQISPTSTTQPTQTLTPTPTATATFTPTSVPKILTYHVTVNCLVDKTIQVELIYSGVTVNQVVSFVFNRGGFAWEYDGQMQTFIKEIEFLDSTGQKLHPLAGRQKDEKNNEVFRVSIKNGETITVRYTVSVGFWDKSDDIFSGGTQLGGYVGRDYCVIEPALLFLTPENINKVNSIRAFFSLPDDWDVVTFWEKQGEFFTTNPSALHMSKGPFGFGQFTTSEKMIGDTRVVVAAAKGVDQPELQLQRAIDLYEHYQSEVFGIRDQYYGTGSPRDGYIVIFIPATGSVDNLYHEEYGLYMSLANRDWDSFAHSLSHNWTMDQERANAPWFITEGIVEYLQVKITHQKGYISNARYREHLRYKYNWYMGVVGTNNDFSLVAAPFDHDIQYHKGALFALLLDDSMKLATDGKVNIEDLMQLLYEKAPVRKLSPQAIEVLTSELTGCDFSTFFQDYVSGTKKLPLMIHDGNVEVDHDAFSFVCN
jgi:predicted metalloprotease with PDZ domain